MFAWYLFLRFKDRREIRQINPLQTLMNLQYVIKFFLFRPPEKLTNPAFQYEGEGFHRSSSNSSLNSILSPEGELHVRTCQECRTLLERRDQQMEQRHSKPMVVRLYEVTSLILSWGSLQKVDL